MTVRLVRGRTPADVGVDEHEDQVDLAHRVEHPLADRTDGHRKDDDGAARHEDTGRKKLDAPVVLVEDVRDHEPQALEHAGAQERLHDGAVDGVVLAQVKGDVLDEPLGSEDTHDVEDVEDEEAHAGEHGALAADEEVREREDRCGHAHDDEDDGIGKDHTVQSAHLRVALNRALASEQNERPCI